tara:strand:+ start:2419 stop:2640 length:222 start_codon:yes stop_codon:yes gene_type:complete
MGIRINMENRIDQIESQTRGIVRKMMILEERLNRFMELVEEDSNEEEKSDKKATGNSGDSDDKRPPKSKRKSK